MSNESIGPVRMTMGTGELKAMLGPAGVTDQDRKNAQQRKKRPKGQPHADEPTGKPDAQDDAQTIDDKDAGKDTDEESASGQSVDCYS